MKRMFKCLLLGLLCLTWACTPKSDVKEVPAEYKTDSTIMKGYIAYDAKIKGKRPGILVIHEWWGMGDFVRDRAKALAGLGYTALAVDMYGDGKQAQNNEEAAKLAREVSENNELKKARFRAALDYLKQQDTVDPEHIAVIGYSFGGYIALEMARMGEDIDAVVTFYGGLTTKDPAQPGSIKAKILICQGEKDWYVPEMYVTEFKQEMKHAGADYKMITYPDAEHGFANPQGDVIKEKFQMHYGFNQNAYNKSWADMQEFLKEVFRKQ